MSCLLMESTLKAMLRQPTEGQTRCQGLACELLLMLFFWRKSVRRMSDPLIQPHFMAKVVPAVVLFAMQKGHIL